MLKESVFVGNLIVDAWFPYATSWWLDGLYIQRLFHCGATRDSSKCSRNENFLLLDLESRGSLYFLQTDEFGDIIIISNFTKLSWFQPDHNSILFRQQNERNLFERTTFLWCIPVLQIMWFFNKQNDKSENIFYGYLWTMGKG